MLPFFLPRQCVQLSSFFRKGFASLGFAVLSVGGWLHSLFHNSPSVLCGKCPCSFSSCFGSVPSGLAASGSNPNYPCSPEVEILLHNQPWELRVLQLRAHLGCLLEVSLERDGRMRREMGAVGVTRVAAVGIGTRNSRVEGEAGRAAYKKLRVEVSLTSLNVWSHQAVPNKRGAAIFAALAPEKNQAHFQHLSRGKRMWDARGMWRSTAVLGGLCWFRSWCWCRRCEAPGRSPGFPSLHAGSLPD